MHTLKPPMADIPVRFYGRFRGSRARLSSAMRLAVVAAGISLVAATTAQAQDDDDEMTFEQGIIHNIMTGIGATNMENRGIDYRERSPLVVPPKIDLPPPESGQSVASAPNWPQDVDEVERKQRRAAERKAGKRSIFDNDRPLSPSELNVGRTHTTHATEPLQPGAMRNPMMSPSELGYKGTLFSTMFGGAAAETKPFTGEPTRETLTQPPPGYQTPSSAYAYGSGPIEINRTYTDIMSGKEVKN